MEREWQATDKGLLHAKAKEEPKRRFHALCEMWREDFLRDPGSGFVVMAEAAGVDGESFKDIEVQGVESWLGELGRDLTEGGEGTDSEETLGSGRWAIGRVAEFGDAAEADL